MPVPNEHSARLRDPGVFDPTTFRRTRGGTIFGSIKVPDTMAVIWAKLKKHNKPEDEPLAQALRFPIKDWAEVQARKWLELSGLEFVRFEAAEAKGVKKMKKQRVSGAEVRELLGKNALAGAKALSKNPQLDPATMVTAVKLATVAGAVAADDARELIEAGTYMMERVFPSRAKDIIKSLGAGDLAGVKKSLAEVEAVTFALKVMVAHIEAQRRA